MLDLYLDTNILLSFYGLSSDDLEELRKLAALLRTGSVRLHLPQQMKEEFIRNRPGKIAEALRRLRDQRVGLQIPQLAREYPAFKEVVRLQRELETAHSRLIADVTSDIEGSSLKADSVLGELFSLANPIPTTPELLNKARTRHDLRNPPGKGDSLGDALNWEALLATMRKRADLIFVTDDGDYASPLREADFHPFLVEEWKTLKSSAVVFYRRLSHFFAARFPDISLTRDAEKDRLIQALAQSASFAETHSLINQLSGYVDYSIAQRNDLLRAAISNNQVGWIILDEDVHDFLQSIVRGYEARLDQNLLREFQTIVQEALEARASQKVRAETAQQEDDDDLPF